MKLSLLHKWIATATLALATAAGAMAATATFTTETTNFDPAGGSVVFAVNIDRETDVLTSIGFEINQPTGWSYMATGADFVPTSLPNFTPSESPQADETTPTLGFAYGGAVTSFRQTFGFTATIAYPAGLTADQVITARLIYSVEGGSGQTSLQMTPITIAPAPTAPAISTQPAGSAVNEGGDASFSVVATGSPAPTYQWKFNGADISGATSSTYSITGVTPANAGSYTVVVTNSQGNVTSDPAVLTVSAAPAITTQPVSVTANEGGTASFSVVATGATPLSYQWRSSPSGAALDGETSATLQISSVSPTMAGSYYVEVTNSVSSVNSEVVTLTVVEKPVITTGPMGQTVAAGSSVAFSFSATGTEPLAIQWFKGESMIAGATSTTYSIPMVAIADAGSYSVRVSNDAGSVTSDPAVLVVEYKPVISAQPENQVSGVNGQVMFSVAADAVPAISGYQWFSVPAGGGTPMMISVATSATLTLPSVQTVDNGTGYYVQITNSIGTTTSDTATLTVNESPAFTSHPQGLTVTEGGAASFMATVTGNPTPTLQWQFSPNAETPMANIEGQTSATLSLTGVTRSQSGLYQLVATNEFGSVESSKASLDVQFRPEITTDLAAVTAGVGESVTLSIVADTNPAISSYQWYRNGNLLSGETNAELSLTGLQLSDSGATFYVIISNGIGDPVQSSTATLTVNEKPVITSQPQSATVVEGSPASFMVTFTGNPTPTFQWMLGGVAIPEATDSTYAIEEASRTQSGAYTVAATNEFGTAMSEPATLDVQFAPEITTDLVDQTVAVGSTVTFAPVGAGNPKPTLQWYRDGSPLSTEMGGQLVLTDVQLSDSGSTFYLEANNGIGKTVKTATVTLTVQQPVAITLEPEGATLDAGASHIFTAAATGVPAPTFQWRKNGVNIPGATDATYTIPSATGTDAGTYTVAATNPQGTVISAGAVIVVNVPPSITTQPVGATKVVGGSHTFTVAATGAATLTYQWKKDGSNIAGATGTSLVLEPLTVENSGVYTVTVTNRLGSATSSPATLTVDKALKAPVITTQPRNISARTGGSATFSVVADGNPLPTYQWRKNGVAISGATSASFVIADTQAASAGGYDVVVANAQGTATSNLVRLTVTAADVAPVITSQPRDKTVAKDTAVTFAVVASGLPAPTYQWRKNGVAIAGATSETYTIASASVANDGAYSVVVANDAGSVTSRNATLRVLTKVYAGTYFGSFGEGRGSFAIVVRSDNTGTFLGFDEGTNLYVSGTVSVDVDGNFELTVTSESATTASSDRTIGADRGNQIAIIGSPSTGAATISLIGSIKENGEVRGTVSGVAGLSMSGAKEEGTASEEVAGFYEASASGSNAVTLTIISPTGKALVLTKSASGAADGGVGTASSEGAIAVTTVKNNTISATVSATSSTIAAEVTDSTGAKTSFTGGSDEVIATQRLVNISTRARAGTGLEQTIAGLVISGQDSKPVLIRAVGPGLSAFDVDGVLAAPKLELRSGQTVIASNTGWSNSANVAEITAAAASAGAFALDSASADSAILETLAPGSYTAMASGADGGTGVVLIEVYDLSTPTPGQKLFNISTRAGVGSGDSIAVAGFVVSGSVPKRVLLRGIGPGLTQFDLTGVLADPQISLVRNGAEIANNNDWGVNATAVAEAASAAGAFAITEGSKDAAMVISLEPGVYTLQLSGVAGSTGIGLIEVYEIP